MPAPLRVRPNFLGDIAFLRRFQKAIEIDKERPGQFRKTAARQIQALLLTLEEQNLKEQKLKLRAEEKEAARG